MSKITWSIMDPDTESVPVRGWELDARDKIRQEYAGSAGQHYVEFEFVEDEECELDCDARFHVKDRCIEAEMIHPLDCEEREPGDGIKMCGIQFEWDEYGLEDELLRNEVTESGIYPIRLFVEEYGGYWEPRDFDCYLLLEMEEGPPTWEREWPQWPNLSLESA